jgi:hypothetical protein
MASSGKGRIGIRIFRSGARYLRLRGVRVSSERVRAVRVLQPTQRLERES